MAASDCKRVLQRDSRSMNALSPVANDDLMNDFTSSISGACFGSELDD